MYLFVPVPAYGFQIAMSAGGDKLEAVALFGSDIYHLNQLFGSNLDSNSVTGLDLDFGCLVSGWVKTCCLGWRRQSLPARFMCRRIQE